MASSLCVDMYVCICVSVYFCVCVYLYIYSQNGWNLINLLNKLSTNAVRAFRFSFIRGGHGSLFNAYLGLTELLSISGHGEKGRNK